ncbi:MAG: FMN-binding negative transcriptional regulator [Alphaproteobacteria bacterium]|nr:FMN-binding negative transcriptional regulator [Alphaproteobacteria bacterium]
MYLRPAFVEHDLDRIAALIEAHSFGLLITSEGGLDASHIPFTLARDGDTLVLEGHLAAANPQCARLAGGAALATFSGPHSYISPSWYRTQPAVPTWDYAAVHVHGVLEPVTAEATVRAMLRRLSAHDASYDLDAQPPAFIAGMLRGIRAFRLRGTRVEAQWKMSQNRSAADRESVAAALRSLGSTDVAALVDATLPPPA